MKKTYLFATLLAVSAGYVQAQSNVTLSGFVAATYANYKVGNSVRTTAAENRLDDGSSRFILKGNEDLGGGLVAYFQIDNRISLDSRPNQAFTTSQGLADGESFVGLRHKDFGQIGFGKYEMHYHETKGYSESYRALNQQLYAGTSILGMVGNTAIAFASRLQNTIKYDTPNWSGFSAKFAYSFNPACNEGTLAQSSNCVTTYANNNVIPSVTTIGGVNYLVVPNRTAVDSNYSKGAAWNLAARYNNGPINAFVSYFDYKTEGRGATSSSTRYNLTTGAATVVAGTDPNRGGQQSWRIGGDYAFPIGVKVGLNYDHSKLIAATSAADASRNAWMLPVSYMTGQHGFYVTYAKAGNISKTSNTGAYQWTVAYDYAFSKRTFAGASYVLLKNKPAGTYNPYNAGISTFGGSNLAAGESARQISFNLTHYY